MFLLIAVSIIIFRNIDVIIIVLRDLIQNILGIIKTPVSKHTLNRDRFVIKLARQLVGLSRLVSIMPRLIDCAELLYRILKIKDKSVKEVPRAIVDHIECGDMTVVPGQTH